eukprot:4007234-Pleurochrysis_carterae.AAC.2
MTKDARRNDETGASSPDCSDGSSQGHLCGHSTRHNAQREPFLGRVEWPQRFISLLHEKHSR